MENQLIGKIKIKYLAKALEQHYAGNLKKKRNKKCRAAQKENI